MNSKNKKSLISNSSKCKLYDFFFFKKENMLKTENTETTKRKDSDDFITSLRYESNRKKNKTFHNVPQIKNISLQSLYFKDNCNLTESSPKHCGENNSNKNQYLEHAKLKSKSKSKLTKIIKGSIYQTLETEIVEQSNPIVNKNLKRNFLSLRTNTESNLIPNSSIKQYLQILGTSRNKIELFSEETKKNFEKKKLIYSFNKKNIKLKARKHIIPLERYEFDYEKLIDEIISDIKLLIEITDGFKRSLRIIKECSSFNSFLFDYLCNSVEGNKLQKLKPYHFHCYLKADIITKYEEDPCSELEKNMIFQKRRVLLINSSNNEIFGKVSMKAINSLKFFKTNMEEKIEEQEKLQIRSQKEKIKNEMKRLENFQSHSPESKQLKSRFSKLDLKNFDILSSINAFESKFKMKLNIPPSYRIREKEMTQAIDNLKNK